MVCSNPSSSIILYLFSGLIILGYILYSIYFTIFAIRRRILVSYLRLMNCLSISKSEQDDKGNVLIKSLVHYFQIVTVLRLNVQKFGLILPFEVQFIPSILGEPIQSLENSFDCAQLGTKDFPPMYVRAVWSLFIPITYSTFLLIFYLIIVQMKIMKHKVSYIWNGSIFIILLMHPGIV